MDAAEIDALCAPWSGADSPGVVWAVTRDGAEIHSGAVGMSDIAHGVPLDRRSLVRIGSQTKQFTVLLALMLEQEGLLSMADEVHRYAPWLPAFPHPVTLQQMSTNTSGLRDVLEAMTLSGVPLGAPASRARQREILARFGGLNFVPGTEMIYCNTNFWLLSEIVEAVSGRSFNELLEARITGPLGMADTRLVPRDTQILPRLSAQHVRGPDGAWETARWGWEIGGEGGMVSTLDDMLRWQANLARPRAEMAAHLARMAEPVVYANGQRGLYAMGLNQAVYRGQRHIGHGGGVAGGRSESMWFPDDGLGVVILANSDAVQTFSLALRMADVALADRLAPPVQGGARLGDGLYRMEGGGDILAVRSQGAEMVTRAGPLMLGEAAPGLFMPERANMHLTLSPGADGDVLDATWCGAPRRLRRLGSAPAGAPTAIAGQYRSEEAGLVADVQATGDGAEMRLRSDFGVHRLQLRWIDSDLLTFVPDTITPAPDRWIGTVQVSRDRLSIVTDRTKGLRLRRAA